MAPVENVILQILAEEAVGKLMIMWLWADEGRSEQAKASGLGPAEGEGRRGVGGTRASWEGTDLSKALAGK